MFWFLSDLGEFTIFAPTDAAFKAVTDDAQKKKLKDEIKTILLGHVIQGKFPSSALTDGLELPALDGENNKIAISPAGISFELI